jgi:hypothetical protein
MNKAERFALAPIAHSKNSAQESDIELLDHLCRPKLTGSGNFGWISIARFVIWLRDSWAEERTKITPLI